MIGLQTTIFCPTAFRVSKLGIPFIRAGSPLSLNSKLHIVHATTIRDDHSLRRVRQSRPNHPRSFSAVYSEHQTERVLSRLHTISTPNYPSTVRPNHVPQLVRGVT